MKNSRIRAVKTFGFCIAALAAFACSNTTSKSLACDGSLVEDGVAAYCAYGVLTGGFRGCPADFPNRIDIPAQGNFSATVVCSNKPNQVAANLPSSVAVANCEQTIQNYLEQCRAEDPNHGRLCLYPFYQELCASDRRQVVQEMFSALSTDACQTPGDPSNAQARAEAVAAANVLPIHTRVYTKYCSLCQPDQPSCTNKPNNELVLHSEASLQGIDTCTQAATTCAGYEECQRTQWSWAARSEQMCADL